MILCCRRSFSARRACFHRASVARRLTLSIARMGRHEIGKEPRPRGVSRFSRETFERSSGRRKSAQISRIGRFPHAASACGSCCIALGSSKNGVTFSLLISHGLTGCSDEAGDIEVSMNYIRTWKREKKTGVS